LQTATTSATADEVAAKRFVLSHPDIFIERYSGLRLKTFQRRILYATYLNERLVVLLPAGHGKSTLISKWYTIWRICQNPNIRIILVMKTDAEVSYYARSIRKELAANHQLIRDFGPFVPRGKDAVWSNDAIEVHKRQIREPQPTVEFASSKSIEQVLGHRCDEYLCDDIVTPSTVSTDDQREKQKGVFNEGIDTGPQPLWDRDPETGLFLNKPDEIYWPSPEEYIPGLEPRYWKGALIGTVFHPADLLHEKARSPQDLIPGRIYKGNAPGWKMMYFDCWEHDADNNVTDNPLWPERWSREALHMKEAGQGTIDFNKRYRNIAVSDADLTFKRIWVKGEGDYPGCLNRRRSWGELPEHAVYPALEQWGPNPPKWYPVESFDPSTGRKNKGSTWSSYVVQAVNMNAKVKRRYLIDIFRAQLGFDDILTKLEEMYFLWGCQLSVIEQNAAQRWLIDNERMKKLQLDRGMVVKGHETQAGNKIDPIMGVGSMQGMVRDGLLDIPYMTPSDKEKAAPFIDQLQLYPEGVTDWVMALWFGDLAFREGQRKFKAWSRGPGRQEVLPSVRKWQADI